MAISTVDEFEFWITAEETAGKETAYAVCENINARVNKNAAQTEVTNLAVVNVFITKN